MKLSINWLKDYVDLPESLDIKQLTYDLTMRTVEVEGFEATADLVEGIVVGLIKSVEAHPDADMLRVCQVDVGSDKLLQIVCGGSNLYEGQKVAVAPPGAWVKWHGEGDPVEIEEAELRGVKSQGMICGASEINLDELFPVVEERQILDLKDFDALAGQSLAEVLGLDDYVLEIDNKSMTHRPDLWGHYGMARELAAIYDKTLKPLPAKPDLTGLKPYPVSIETDKCLRYDGLIYDSLHVETSPFEMRKRLWSVDIRPINNLVDITNYVMLTTGQPTHGFDKSHVENGILVRQAMPGEKLILLDEQEIALNEDNMLITDGQKPIALAGVMGGKQDSILPDTKSMVLEVASFDSMSIRKTSLMVGERTEASTRYEKSIDTARVDQAIALAHRLITDLIPDATLVAFGQDVQSETQCAEVDLSLKFLASRIGEELSVEDVKRNLEPLGFKILGHEGDKVEVLAPVWRSTGDISLQADLLEEIARMIGYENFDYEAPQVKLENFVKQPKWELERRVMDFFSQRGGFREIYSYPWVHEHLIEAAGLDASDWLSLEDPPSPEEKHLRASLIPGMLGAIDKNLANYDSFRIMELAQVFSKGHYCPSEEEEVLPIQKRELALALVGSDAMDLFRQAKGLIENLPAYAHCENLHFAPAEKAPWADPKMYLQILNDADEVLGELGLLSIKAESIVGIKFQRTLLIRMDMDKLQPLASRQNRYEPLPSYPEVWKDLNVVVGEDVSWQAISDTVSPLVKRVQYLEEYRGNQVEAGKKSLSFRYWIGSDEKTLSSEDIDKANRQILQTLETDLGAKLRA